MVSVETVTAERRRKVQSLERDKHWEKTQGMWSCQNTRMEVWKCNCEGAGPEFSMICCSIEENCIMSGL